MPVNTSGGTTTSFTNTPQAQTDTYWFDEEELAGYTALLVDVMGNDLGGKAKILWSIDDGSNDTGQMNSYEAGDLLTQDQLTSGVSAWQQTEQGNWIRINNGQVEYRLGNGTSANPDNYPPISFDAIPEGLFTDSFIYAIRMSNGTLSWATVTVNIQGSNDPPVANADTGSAGENESKAFSVLANDTDIDEGAVLTLASLDGVMVDGVAADAAEQSAFSIVGNQIQFTPGTAFDHLAQGASSTVVVTYTVSDEHGATSSSTLTLTVTGTNDGPAANADTDTTAENAVLTVDVLGNDTDVDNGAVLTVTAASAPAGQGTASVVGNQVQFDPGTDFDYLAVGESALVVVSYSIEDEHGAGSSSTLTITVTGTNDAPVASPVADDANEDGPAVTVAASFTDADTSDSHTFSVDTTGTLGSVTDNGNGTFTYDPNGQFESLAAGETTVDTFTYTVDDGNGGTDTETVTITVHGQNDGPAANADSDTTAENAILLVDVLGNDTDVDNGAVLTVTAASAPAGQGSASVVGNQVQFDPGTDFDYLAVGESALVVVSYSIEDEYGAGSSSTLTITVTGTNDAPALTAAQATLAGGSEDTPYNVTTAQLLTGFSDPDSSDVLAVFGLTASNGAIVSQNLDGSYTITPGADYNGPITLSYSVIDGHGGSVPASLSFNLAPVNDPAVIGGDDDGDVYEATASDPGTPTANGTLTAADVDNNPNTFQAAAGSTAYGSFTINASGNWQYTLNNANATVNALAAGVLLADSFTVYSEDGTAHTVNITIHGADDLIVVTQPTPFTGSGDPNDYDGLVGTGTVNNGLTIIGSNTLGDNITGGSADQDINGRGGNDTIYGAGGDDDIDGGADNDTLYGQAGSDNINGNNGIDSVYGGSGDDDLVGGNEVDTIYGGSGSDTIVGNNGDDTIVGGYGADTLTGSGGSDTFVYLSVLDTNDTIIDFMAGEEIDLSALGLSGWSGETPTANSLWMVESGGNTTLFADTDGNVTTAEFMLTLQGFTGFDPLTPPPEITF